MDMIHILSMMENRLHHAIALNEPTTAEERLWVKRDAAVRIAHAKERKFVFLKKTGGGKLHRWYHQLDMETTPYTLSTLYILLERRLRDIYSGKVKPTEHEKMLLSVGKSTEPTVSVKLDNADKQKRLQQSKVVYHIFIYEAVY